MVTFGSNSQLMIVNDIPFYAFLILDKYGLEGCDVPETTHTHWLQYFEYQESEYSQNCDCDYCDCSKGPPLSVNW